VNPQTPAAQVAVPFIGSGHLWPHVPQSFVLVSGSTQAIPHRSGVVAAQPFVHANDAADGWQYGVAAGHATAHPPQLVAFERSVSQPSVGILLQSAKPGSHPATMHAPAAQFAAA